VALALVCAGAVGNLLDRMRSIFGVVDFLDVGVGDARWPTFNVADMAVSVGAALLAYVLWQEDREARADEAYTLAASSVPATVVTAVTAPTSGAESVDVA
jgi:signal peptidase II